MNLKLPYIKYSVSGKKESVLFYLTLLVKDTSVSYQ